MTYRDKMLKAIQNELCRAYLAIDVKYVELLEEVKAANSVK